MSDTTDPEVERLRAALTELDEGIVAEVNRRLELVAELKRVKEERGLGFLDPAREEWLLAHLAERNRGPLSERGVRALYTELLALTKRELG